MAISDNIILHAVADDIKPSCIRGYETQVNRDGAVVYSSGGKPVLLDRGLFIEVANALEEKSKPLAMALHITDQKSGERVEVRGEPGFVQRTTKFIPHFNVSTGKRIDLTHPIQRRQAGYPTANQDNTPSEKTVRHKPPKPH
ncbi:hypothetical protein [Enterobacter bugandensis]|uniref:hypothetical protein n=1 Tax=Enterobacter bugandensis TaxID=881260 RepID=UPI002A81A1B9|nr:hypothetical protein [Enterobacter bugandensis]